MAVTKDKKKELLDQARSIFSESATSVFVKSVGLGANDTNAMRGAMTNEGVGYRVIKKTLIAKALDETEIKGDRPAFDGELAVAYGEDLIAPARLVREFQKKHKANIEIVGGVFDGTYMDQSEMKSIAEIPDLPVLRGMFVNMINTPLQQLAVVTNAIAEQKEAAA